MALFFEITQITPLFSAWIPANSKLQIVFTSASSTFQETFKSLIPQMAEMSADFIVMASFNITPITELLNPTPMMITKVTMTAVLMTTKLYKTSETLLRPSKI